MSKKNCELTLDRILNESRWVAKMQGYRVSGTYAEVKQYAEDEDCRDFDLSATQPEHLKEFFDAYWSYDSEHGFITIQDFFHQHYGKMN